MSVRFDDADRVLLLSVRDLVEAGAPSGHLTLEVVQRRATRALAGQRVHAWWQAERGQSDATYRPEVNLKHQLVVHGWTVTLQGRLDGLFREDGRTVVEEIKSTALDGSRLLHTTADDWPRYVAQLEIYAWMLAEAREPEPTGRLVLVSLADGARHILGVPLDRDRVGATVLARLAELVLAREARLAWLAARRATPVRAPHAAWRSGQREITEAVEWGLDAGHQVLVEAPTGMGKTSAVLDGVLRHAFAHDKQVFWATARTTQQRAVEATLDAVRRAGTPLRSVVLTAREKACLNEVVACRPDACRFARNHHDKVRELGLVEAALGSHGSRGALRDLGERHVVCPFDLAMRVSEQVDVVVADYNYALAPSVQLRQHFGETARDWVLVVDEAHQLVDRARSWGSPRVEAGLADRAAVTLLSADRRRFGGFALLARDIAARVREACAQTAQREHGFDRVARDPDPDLFAALAERLDEVALEYGLLKAELSPVAPGQPDPWLELARQVLSFQQASEAAGEETVTLLSTRPGEERVSLLCLDPSGYLGPRLAATGGFVALSATLSPHAFYRDLLGLAAERLDVVHVPPPFPPERRRVLIAPRVSTDYKDRQAHAEPTAALIRACVEATPGHSACYFPSFEMLRDITSRWAGLGRELLVQHPSMGEDLRQAWLSRIQEEREPLVLAAVLGGIFAEGIDLPGGALKLVVVAGTALPPVGLERDLLREHYDRRYGEGFRYASLVPGLTRVVQAAGRLIRSSEDRGVIVLVGRRFRWREVYEQLPRDWEPRISTHPERDVADFWASPP